jgi:outer membrane protein OmpA-like peptidoglycan-associated protein
LAARNYLKDNGVDKDLIVEIFGERRPASSNTVETGRRMNRRAEVLVYFRDPSQVSYRLYGMVMDAATGRPLIAEIAVSGYRDDTVDLKTATDGLYDIRFKTPRTMTLTAFAEGFVFQTREVPADTFDLGDNNEIVVNFMLRKIEKGLKFDLRNIYFEGNKAVILSQSWPELQRLTKMMQDNPTLQIELRGHVNWPSTYPQPITFFAVTLSGDRAKTVYDYLVYNRVHPARMRYKGMSNLEMIYPDTDQEPEMALNRRVEVVILDY